MATAETAASALPAEENATPALQAQQNGGEGGETATGDRNGVGEVSVSAATPSPTSPLLPLPATFMTALNMKPQTAQGGGGQDTMVEKKSAINVEDEDLTLGPGTRELLAEKFKKSKYVLGALQWNLRMPLPGYYRGVSVI
jgi:hypothetical protein